MFKNYCITALRNLNRYRGYSFINIAGLALGIACCIVILLYVREELNYDGFHTKADRIVRVTMEYGVSGEVNKVAVTGTKVAPAFKQTFPEIEAAVRTYRTSAVVQFEDKLFEEKQFLYADSTFFRVFTFPLLKGNPATALDAPNQVVLTQQAAARYFGQANPMGKTLRINDDTEYIVAGIMAEIPANSQLKFDFVASFSNLAASKNEQWFSANYLTYLLLQNPNSIKTLQAKIPAYMQSQSQETEMTDGNYLTYNLEPIREVHLYSELAGFEPNSDSKYIYIFSGIALLILAIACVNYMNLATARATDRAREVGVRKVMGAGKGQLFWQFIGESVVVITFAVLLSLSLVYLLLPVFNQLANRELVFASLVDTKIIVAILFSGVLLSLLAGSYPAVVLSKFQPMKVLKGDFKTSGSGTWLRRGLIVCQFVISSFLIISTLIMLNQLNFIQNKKLGYDREQVVVLPLDKKVMQRWTSLKNEWKRKQDVQQVTAAYETPTFIEGGYSIRVSTMPQGQYKPIKAIPVEKDFASTIGLEIVAGSDFTQTDEQLSQSSANKDEKYYAFLLNESAVSAFGWTPEEAIGKQVDMGQRKGPVRGVVKDFHFASLREIIEPLVIFIEPIYYGNIMVKIAGTDVRATLSDMENTWKTMVPHRPFEYKFLDEEFNQLYHSEQQMGKVFAAFASLAILLACLGLFGLAAFTTSQRTKEIGIRKVLGASLGSIVGLLAKDFLILVALANLVAWPVAWFAMHQWLEDFAYRIDVNPWLFVLAAVMAIVIAFLTVSYQSVQAALANPVKSLRNE